MRGTRQSPGRPPSRRVLALLLTDQNEGLCRQIHTPTPAATAAETPTGITSQIARSDAVTRPAVSRFDSEIGSTSAVVTPAATYPYRLRVPRPLLSRYRVIPAHKQPERRPPRAPEKPPITTTQGASERSTPYPLTTESATKRIPARPPITMPPRTRPAAIHQAQGERRFTIRE
jgi:hypothetical protein